MASLSLWKQQHTLTLVTVDYEVIFLILVSRNKRRFYIGAWGEIPEIEPHYPSF